MSSQISQSRPSASPPNGDRPRQHDGTSDTERTIFAAVERLLADVPLHKMSVAQIIREADVSRATFYFYFSSKYAVVTGLLRHVMGEIYEAVEPFRGRQSGEPRDEALRRSLEAGAALWRAHRPVLRATVEHWHAVPELRTVWLGVVDRFTRALANDIDRERAEGLAPPGPDSRALAATLVWATERCLYVAGLGADEDLPNEQDVVEPITALWVGALYGVAPAKATARRAAAKRPARRAGS